MTGNEKLLNGITKSKPSREYPLYPRIGVGILVQKNDQFLLIKRGQEPSKGVWTVPGGHVELGESLGQTAHREIAEECNIKIEALKQLDVFEFIQHGENNRIKYHYIVIDFFAHYVDGVLKARDDIDEARWLRKEEIGELNLPEDTLLLLRKARMI